MSKAFTKDDAESELPVVVPRRAPLPAGTPNYVTERGLAALQAELVEARQTRAQAERSDLERERARISAMHAARIAELEARIASAVLVEPSPQPQAQVRFGATVRVRSSAGAERSYRIVGVDEADARRGSVAFVAPLARALLGKSQGEVALVVTPAGEEELEVLAISYE